MIPYGRQDITQADIDAVVSVLRSDFLTQGPVVPRFEKAVSDRVSAKYAVAVNSGTSALHVACMALQLGEGDCLWTVPNTFAASANCALYCGADIDFVDIDAEDWNLSLTHLKEKLLKARKNECLPKVVVPVHYAGQPTHQEAIWELAQEFGFKVLEDASHSIGASRHGEPVGSCRWSDVCVFSFHPVKVVTSAEGGMGVTNDEEIAERMAMLRSHGITRDPSKFRNIEAHGNNLADRKRKVGAWHYEQQMLGYNYRLTDLHAAIGVSQLERLEQYVSRRSELARRYDQALTDLPIQLPTVAESNNSAHHLYTIRMPSDSPAERQRNVFDALRERGIGVNVHYIPVHLHPYYRQLGFSDGQFPEAELHGRTAITLPLFPTMTDDEQAAVINAVKDVL
ncbi:MAG: UDP-4-amino-4,6-dideoxy-N-acetyl-beta-L-altrosamine transaminase [Woeseiaceae bacterium]